MIGELVKISLAQVCRVKVYNKKEISKKTQSIADIDDGWRYVSSSYKDFYKKIWLIVDVSKESDGNNLITYYVLRSSCISQYVIKVYCGSVTFIK